MSRALFGPSGTPGFAHLCESFHHWRRRFYPGPSVNFVLSQAAKRVGTVSIPDFHRLGYRCFCAIVMRCCAARPPETFQTFFAGPALPSSRLDGFLSFANHDVPRRQRGRAVREKLLALLHVLRCVEFRSSNTARTWDAGSGDPTIAGISCGWPAIHERITAAAALPSSNKFSVQKSTAAAAGKNAAAALPGICRHFVRDDSIFSCARPMTKRCWGVHNAGKSRALTIRSGTPLADGPVVWGVNHSYGAHAHNPWPRIENHLAANSGFGLRAGVI